jgi:hypothetical protein
VANTLNTGVYPQEWMTKLQERLDKPTNWKEVCEVIYSDTKIFNLPYMSTEFVIQTGTRGTAYGFSDFTLTNDTLDINTYKPVPVFIDRADLAQCKLVNQMELADRQGQIINEWIESAVLADHASWTNFTNADIGGSAGNITVSASNIDDIIRGIKREIGEANGQAMADRNGIFIVWRYADLEILEQFAQANGFNLADKALKNGLKTGYHFMGVDHYVSNSHTSGHLFAGVKKVQQVGILKSTYGQIVVTQDPALQSGIGVISRVDYGLNARAAHTGLLFDVNVA